MRLSICIPTYNRSDYLPDTVHSVFASIGSAKATDVEVLISNNASTDKTQQVAVALQRQYPSLKYYENQENVMDENFFVAARRASGTYIWILGDDDLLLPEAIEKVLQAIEEGRSHIVLNYSIWDKEMAVQLRPHRYRIEEDKTISNKDEVLRVFGVGLQFISATICRRDIFLDTCPADYKAFHKYGNSFLLATYASLTFECNFHFFARPLLRYRGYNSNITGVPHWYKIFINGNAILLNRLRKLGYQTSAVRSARAMLISQYLTQDVVHRKKTGQQGMLGLIPASFYTHARFLFITLPILIVPGALFRPLYKLILPAHAHRS